MKKTSVLCLLASVLCLALTGCVHVLNQPSGKILSVTERGIGFKVSQSAANQSPEVMFGFFSSAVVILPTSTNGTVSSPNFANTFGFQQRGALSLGIDEQIASGNYSTFQPGGTNSAPVTAPGAPR